MNLKEFRDTYGKFGEKWFWLSDYDMQNIFVEAFATINTLEEIDHENFLIIKGQFEQNEKLEAENKELKAKQFDRAKALSLLRRLDGTIDTNACDCKRCTASRELRKMLEGV